MTAVDIFKAERMLQIENTTVVGGLVDSSGNLLLTTREGTEIEAGHVVGPQGSGFTHRGAWTPTTVYAVGDVVTAGGSTFVVNVAHTSSTTAPSAAVPGANLSLWAAKGDSGTNGVGYNYRGEWAPATAYVVRDIVTSNGSTFIVNTAHTSSATAPTASVPGSNLALWARQGSDGIIGSDGATAIAAGTVSLWPGDVAPSNWMICDGAAVSRITYASLFSAIGTKYGVGDGSTTFNLPNLKGKSPFGRDAAQTEFDVLGETGGTKVHNHQHISPVGSASLNTYVFTPYSTALDSVGKYDLDHIETVNNVSGIGANGAGANEVYRVTSSDSGTLPPYFTINFIIKVTNGDTPGDSQLTQRVSQLEVVAGTKSLGTISPYWVVGNPSVTLTSGTVVTALHGSRGGPYNPGDKVLCENVSGVWYITDLVEANGPKWTNWIPVPILPGKTIRPFAPPSWGIRSPKYWDKDQTVPFWMTKNSSGVVSFQGLGYAAVALAANEIFATLPVGFRPSTPRRFPCIVSEVRTTLEISTNGDMRFNLAVAVGSWFSLSNAIFHDISQDLNWQPPSAFVNGYTESSPSYPVGFAIDEFGFAWARGIISTSGAARTDAQLMASFPASYMPAFERFLPSANAPSPYVSFRPASGNGVAYRVPSGGAVPNLVMGLDGLMWAPTALQSLFNGFGPGSSAADPLGVNPFLNSWVNYDTALFGFVGFNKRPDGLMYWQGLVKLGTVGYAAMFEIHPSYRPFSRTAIERIGNGLHVRIGIDPINNAGTGAAVQGSMFVENGPNAWVDLTGVVYQAAQ